MKRSLFTVALSLEVSGRQAEIEREWDAMVKANYVKAKELAEKAQSLL